MNVRVCLYDQSNIDRLTWPNTDYGRYAKAYLLPMIQEGADRFIGNAHTRIIIAQVDDLMLPVTVNDAEYDNSYVCSPYTHYIRYAKKELGKLQQPLLERALSLLLSGLGVLFEFSRFNRVVHVNNWLLSTNLYPRMTREQWQAVLGTIRESFPQHAVIFRSLNPCTNREELEWLDAAGCKMVPSRQIYMFKPDDPSFTNAKARWLVKRDYELLAKNGYQVVAGSDMPEANVPRIVELYNQLYLAKYSPDNPQLLESFVRTALLSGTLSIYGLQKDGRLDAVLGFFCREGVMTTPLFGYDTTMPVQTGLYRMLSAVLIRLACENGHLLHESSGAAQFKRNRGSVAAFEYSAVYDKHLPWGRRWCWSLLEALLKRIGLPMMRKLKL